jgi:aminoglycoside 3-N-acetyltransferase
VTTASDAARPSPEGRHDQGLSCESLARDLRSLGVIPGRTLLVHASMRGIGKVRGGAQDVVAALRQVLGQDATLVVPTGTADNSDTSRLYLARTAGMTSDEIGRYRDSMPPFTLERPSVGMGRIAECVRTAPGAVRSRHPQTSFAALGPSARMLMTGHRLDCHLGESSPLGRLYEAGAWVLLMGVGYEACTCFHLAEYRYLPLPPRQIYSCVIAKQGQRQWWSYEDVVLDDGDFAALGAAFEQTGHVVRGFRHQMAAGAPAGRRRRIRPYICERLGTRSVAVARAACALFAVWSRSVVCREVNETRLPLVIVRSAT